MDQKRGELPWEDVEPDLVFPIDFTSRESAEKFDQDARGFRDHVLRNPLFCDILQKLSASTGKKDSMPPIPLEAIPLLDSFYHLAKQAKPGYHNAIYLWQEGSEVEPNIMDRFLDDLYRDLYNRIAPPAEDTEEDLNEFCRQALFQNQHFQSTIFNSVWNQHVSKRYKQLHDLINQASFEVQVKALKDCLISLERLILSLQVEDKKGSDQLPEPKEDPEEAIVLRQLLNHLLSLRMSWQASDDNHRVIYTLPDIPVNGDKTLRDAFDSLGSRKGRNPSKDFTSLLDASRRAYLLSLPKIAASHNDSEQYQKACSLEKEYKQLYRYLRFSSLEQNYITDRIKKSCIRYCQKIIAECMYEYPQEQSGTSSPAQSNYDHELIDSLTYSFMEQAIACFHETMQIVTQYNAGRFAATDYVNYHEVSRKFGKGPASGWVFPISQSSSGKHSFYQDTMAFYPRFQEIWEFIYQDSTPLFDEISHCFRDPDTIARKLMRDGRDTAQFFSIKAPFSSKQAARSMIEYYNEIVSHPDRFYPPDMFWFSIPPMLSFLLLQILKKAVEDCVPKLVAFFSPYFSSQQEDGTQDSSSK